MFPVNGCVGHGRGERSVYGVLTDREVPSGDPGTRAKDMPASMCTWERTRLWRLRVLTSLDLFRIEKVKISKQASVYSTTMAHQRPPPSKRSVHLMVNFTFKRVRVLPPSVDQQLTISQPKKPTGRSQHYFDPKSSIPPSHNQHLQVFPQIQPYYHHHIQRPFTTRHDHIHLLIIRVIRLYRPLLHPQLLTRTSSSICHQDITQILQDTLHPLGHLKAGTGQI